MKVVLRGSGRDAMWRIILLKDGVFRLQKKGFRGRKWVEAGYTSGQQVNSIRRLTKGVVADWY